MVQAKYGLDAWAAKKARIKLITAAAKAKKDLSPHGVTHSSVSVECLMEDRDFSTKLVRGRPALTPPHCVLSCKPFGCSWSLPLELLEL
jgi:hypothetical protein